MYIVFLQANRILQRTKSAVIVNIIQAKYIGQRSKQTYWLAAAINNYGVGNIVKKHPYRYR